MTTVKSRMPAHAGSVSHLACVNPYVPFSPQRRTTAWMQELAQRRKQLPKGRREFL